jgi:hypothetical protein
MDKIRVLRVIEYTGDREWIEKTLEKSLHGTWRLPNGGEIRSSIIGDFAEIVPKEVHEGIPSFDGDLSEIDRNA